MAAARHLCLSLTVIRTAGHYTSRTEEQAAHTNFVSEQLQTWRLGEILRV
jgi:hypothetical protein